MLPFYIPIAIDIAHTVYSMAKSCATLYQKKKITNTAVNIYLFEVMNSKPYLSLSIEHAAQVTPRHGKTRLGLNRLQIARLW